MSLITKFNSLINNDNAKIILFDDKIYVENFIDVDIIDGSKIIVKLSNKNIIIKGNNLVVSKLTNCDVLISGILNNIEFR